MSADPDDQSDYPDHWCDDCLAVWRGGIEAEMQRLDEEYDANCKALMTKWKAKSLGQGFVLKEVRDGIGLGTTQGRDGRGGR